MLGVSGTSLTHLTLQEMTVVARERAVCQLQPSGHGFVWLQPTETQIHCAPLKGMPASIMLTCMQPI